MPLLNGRSVADFLQLARCRRRKNPRGQGAQLVHGHEPPARLLGATTRTYHHTAPTNALYALHESRLMLREEGLENAWARHQRNHLALKAGLETLGLKYLVEEPYRLPQMNAVSVAPGIDEKEVRRRLLLDYNLEIGAGLGDLAGKIWRFGLMGYSCKMENVMLSLCALETVFTDMGVNVKFGEAEAAAYHAYAAHPSRLQPVRAVA